MLMTAFRSPAWTSDRLWMGVLQQYHQGPLPRSYDGMPPQLALFLLLFTNGDEPPPIRMFIITLRGNTGLLDLYLRARPETRSDKLACSACLVLAERLRKRDTVDFLRRQTRASRDLGDRLCAEAEQFWTVDRGRYLPTTAMAREELEEARQDWRVIQRRQKAARDKAKRRARDDNWEESLLQDLKSRSYSLSTDDRNVGRLSVRSQRAWEAMKTRAVLAEEETETLKLVRKLFAYLDSVSSQGNTGMSLPLDLACLLIDYLDLQSAVRYLDTQHVERAGLDALWRILLIRDFGHGHCDGGLHVGPGRTLLQMALKGCGVIEARAALDYFQGLADNTTACSAALYLCAKTDDKNDMLELLLSRTKADPDSVGALHEAARRFCYKNVKSMLEHGGAFRGGVPHGEEKSALWNAINSHISKPRRLVEDDAVELTCEVLAKAADDGDIIEELELAVKHRDKLCARGHTGYSKQAGAPHGIDHCPEGIGSGSKIFAHPFVSAYDTKRIGATAGIGQATARRLAELGCELYLLGRRTDRLEALQKELEGQFPEVKVHCIPLDVKDTKAIEELPGTIGEPLDILVNNAGYAAGVPKAWEADVDDIRSMFEVNVIGYMAMIKAFVPGMLKAGEGHILNVSSVAGREPYTGGSIYNGTKFAVNGYSMAARMDLVDTPIRVTCVSPGLVETEFSLVRLEDEKAADAVYEGVIPLNASDIADNIVYALTRPRHVQIADITTYATNQARANMVARVGKDLGAESS
ncbi:hypothetical protein FOZ60_016442 [Perkinsus olseni]|uniref:Dehydrogenase reductase SDR member 7B n=1 Tax=Perkinsus olseni TaxID=32597 RepID=A0A7J6P5C3_PEROL|nr:hypothetical protein FOZ60_016442 [Perkinsus olseni]